MRLLRLFLACVPMTLLAPADAAAQPQVPRVPICAGMTLVTAVNDATGDDESIKTVVAADDAAVRLKYSAQKMDFGDMSSTAKPTVRTYLSRRVVRREDMRTSRAYLQEFSPVIPEAVPGRGCRS